MKKVIISLLVFNTQVLLSSGQQQQNIIASTPRLTIFASPTYVQSPPVLLSPPVTTSHIPTPATNVQAEAKGNAEVLAKATVKRWGNLWGISIFWPNKRKIIKDYGDRNCCCSHNFDLKSEVLDLDVVVGGKPLSTPLFVYKNSKKIKKSEKNEMADLISEFHLLKAKLYSVAKANEPKQSCWAWFTSCCTAPDVFTTEFDVLSDSSFTMREQIKGLPKSNADTPK